MCDLELVISRSFKITSNGTFKLPTHGSISAYREHMAQLISFMGYKPSKHE